MKKTILIMVLLMCCSIAYGFDTAGYLEDKYDNKGQAFYTIPSRIDPNVDYQCYASPEKVVLADDLPYRQICCDAPACSVLYYNEIYNYLYGKDMYKGDCNDVTGEAEIIEYYPCYENKDMDCTDFANAGCGGGSCSELQMLRESECTILRPITIVDESGNPVNYNEGDYYYWQECIGSDYCEAQAMQGSGTFRDIAYTKTIEPGEAIAFNGKFDVEYDGDYYIEARFEEAGALSTYSISSSRSKCDGSTNGAGDYVANAKAGDTISFQFNFIPYSDSRDTQRIIGGAYTGCYDYGGALIKNFNPETVTIEREVEPDPDPDPTPDPTKTCSELGGDCCTANEYCPGGSYSGVLGCTSICCQVTCQTTPIPDPDPDCVEGEKNYLTCENGMQILNSECINGEIVVYQGTCENNDMCNENGQHYDIYQKKCVACYSFEDFEDGQCSINFWKIFSDQGLSEFFKYKPTIAYGVSGGLVLLLGLLLVAIFKKRNSGGL